MSHRARHAPPALLVAALLAAASGAGAQHTEKAPPPGKGYRTNFRLASTAFEAHAEIPKRFTCDGEELSPPLSWSGAPAGTKSFALVVDDPDAPDPKAPKVTWVHWVMYDIPPSVHDLAEGAAKQPPAGARAGTNDWKRTGYGGPCPPIGRHRYFHKLYALDVALPDLARPTKPALEKAMAGHVLAKTELVGTYARR